MSRHNAFISKMRAAGTNIPEYSLPHPSGLVMRTFAGVSTKRYFYKGTLSYSLAMEKFKISNIFREFYYTIYCLLVILLFKD